MKHLIDEGKPIVYQDETWTYRRGTGKSKEWQDSDVRSHTVRNDSTGDRYLICNAGGRSGFVPECSLFYRTAVKPRPDDDYHGDMNGELFQKWFKERLVPNIREPSIIVMDNASYHSQRVHQNPTQKWTIAQIQKWLDDHNIRYEPGTTKKELLVIVQLNKPEVRYQLDDYVAKCTDHEIVRLPPYHSIYNPIEMVWSQMKRYYDKNIGRNNDYSHEMAETIWAEALACVSIQQWENYCRHTETRILEDYAREVSDDCNREAYQIQIVCDEDDADNGDDDGADADNFTAMQVTVDLDSRIHNSASLEMNLGSVRRSLLTAFESEMLADPPQSDEDMVAGLQMETDFADHSVLPAIPSSDSTNCSPRTLDHESQKVNEVVMECSRPSRAITDSVLVPIPDPERDSRPHWSSLMDRKGVVELATSMNGVLLHQSARFHQGHERFPVERRNSQCTANAVVAIAVLLGSPVNVTRDLLDQILIDGDRLYVDSRTERNIVYQHLSPEDLQNRFTACGQAFTIGVYFNSQGFLSSETTLHEITESISSNAAVYQHELERTGFLYISEGKTVAYIISPQNPNCTRQYFYLFNPHAVDNNNHFPRIARKGAARLFRCLSANALAQLLLTQNYARRNGWQMYRIKIENSTK
ncbi:uncharacterized protein LOC135164386 isoform X2 [Diachasmimorpha longicaudata]|uniref:uncharacterized protein LOC135161948 isoform X2 n=1 Tax=Diachasmimorpha longicaudata TaxID=58733 RepID=UPI0030B8C52A